MMEWPKDLRAFVEAVLEFAQDVLECEGVVVALPQRDCSHVVRGLMYLGFSLVHPDVYEHSPDYVLLMMEL